MNSEKIENGLEERRGMHNAVLLFLKFPVWERKELRREILERYYSFLSIGESEKLTTFSITLLTFNRRLGEKEVHL